MTSQKTKKVLEVMFADQEISFIGTTQLDMPIDGPGTKLLIAAAEEIDKNGKTAFSQALLPGGPGHISDHITFDSTKDKTRVIIFNNDRGTMPVVAVFSESNVSCVTTCGLFLRALQALMYAQGKRSKPC